MSKEGKIRGNLHPMMDGDRDGDPHWSTGLSPQGPNEEQKEGEHHYFFFLIVCVVTY